MRCGVLSAWLFSISVTTAFAEEFRSATPPFRVALLSLRREREVRFVHGPWIDVDELGVQHATTERTPGAGTAAAPDLYARLRIETEPPIRFRVGGPPRVEEAIDDLGQSLEPFEADGSERTRRGAATRSAYTASDLRVPLSLPEQPGRAIKRLRGVVPITFTARSPRPRAVLDLSRAKGQNLTVGDSTVTITAVSVKSDRSAALKLRVRLNSEKGGRPDREYQESLAVQLADVVQAQVDIVDDQSRPVKAYASTVVRRNEAYATLTVHPDDAFGAPDRLRVWDLSRTSRDVLFEFENVPLP